MQVNMTSPDGVTLETAGKHCQENVNVVPGFDFIPNAKRWDITFASAVSSDSCIIMSDSWLAEHFSDGNLVLLLMIKGDITTSSVTQFTVATNGTSGFSQYRWAGSFCSYPSGATTTPINTESTDVALGYIRVTETGDLYLGGNSTYGYQAGDYVLIGFLR